MRRFGLCDDAFQNLVSELDKSFFHDVLIYAKRPQCLKRSDHPEGVHPLDAVERSSDRILDVELIVFLDLNGVAQRGR